ncbi:MAG: thermonuclease family protein [Mesorhizobium sp.]|nr:MAG: thermonuclease family protein [Mesorhizobium sp.]
MVRGHFTQWQRQFLLDMRDRLVKYGPRTRLSAKQWAKLHEIIGPAPASSYALSQPRPNKAPSSPRRRTRGWRGPVAHEARYLAARFARTFGIALALIVGSLMYSFVVKGGDVTWPSLPSFARSDVAGDRVLLARTQFSITDGDTIRLNGAAKGTRLSASMRPNASSQGCDAEGNLGRRAKARLTELVATAKLELEMVPCSCPVGTQGTDKCNYGRSCGVLFAAGRDVGVVLVSEGLAVPFVCGSTNCPQTPRPWCG